MESSNKMLDIMKTSWIYILRGCLHTGILTY